MQKGLAEPEMLTTEEKWERAGLTDTFIFYKVMTENPDACRRLLELLLHVKIEKIEILGKNPWASTQNPRVYGWMCTSKTKTALLTWRCRLRTQGSYQNVPDIIKESWTLIC